MPSSELSDTDEGRCYALTIFPTDEIYQQVKVGDRVPAGAPLATLEKSVSPDGLELAAAELYKAFRIAPAAPEPVPLILERV